MESGLVGLRAELQKKRAEANKFGGSQRGHRQDAAKKIKNTKSFNISNAGVIARAARDREQMEEEAMTEERAKSILEKKAAMYERLHGGVEALEDDSLNQKYLVNFQKKIVDDVLEKKKNRELEEEKKEEQNRMEKANPKSYKASKQEEEWVEYTDVLGRTRTCMRKDLPEMVEKDKELAREALPDEPPEPDLLSDDMRREIQRQKWETEEEINAEKKDIHYQDVTFDEARLLGTGYMKFSRDEKERKEQMELLNELHKEAKIGEKNKKAAAAKKEKMLQARLEKVRQRKRLKMGLPIKDLEQSRLKTPPTSDNEEEEEMVGPPMPPNMQANEPSREQVKAEKKRKHTREWDIGKDGVKSTLSQEEWVLRQREQRNNEFAPPTAYNSNKWHNKQKTGSSSKNTASSSTHEDQEISQSNNDSVFGMSDFNPPPDNKEERKNEFAPPPTYEYYGPSSSKGNNRYKKPSYRSMEDAIDKGIASLRKMCDS